MSHYTMRKTATGKVHLMISSTAANCNSRSGVRAGEIITVEKAMKMDKESFCKMCFGLFPHQQIQRLNGLKYF